MGRPVYSIERVAVYRALSPILMLPRVWIQFLAASFSWVFLAIAAVWSWNATIYWIPTFGLAAFALVVPFQESQIVIISVLERIFETVDAVFNEVYFPIAEDLMYLFQPICWLYNFLWDLIVPLFEIAIYDNIKLALMIAVPVDPFAFYKQIKLQANGFPIGFTIDTSGSPDWVVGPYDNRHVDAAGRGDRIFGATEDDPAFRYALDKRDPVARFLVQWLDRQAFNATRHHGRLHPERAGVLAMTFLPGELERWTDPRQPAVVRRAAGEAILRRAMDRSLGLEEPSWFERHFLGTPSAPLGTRVAGAPPNGSGPVDSRTRWQRVFGGGLSLGVPGSPGDHVGLARMEGAPHIPEEALDAPTRARLERFKDAIAAGTVAYRYVALGPHRREIAARDHGPDIIMEVAGFLNDLFDTVSRVFIEFLRITARIGVFLYTNIRDFFDDAVDFIVNIFNEIWSELLNLPCLKFDSFEVFAISMMDCICGPLTDAIQGLSSNLSRWFNYSRPSSLGGVPQAFLGCVGLGCIDISQLTDDPLSFLAGMLRRCMGLPHQAACCVVNPIGCFMNLIVDVLNCGCNGNWSSISAPSCNWIMGPFDRWIKCLIIWLNNNIIYKVFQKNACQMSGCPSLLNIGSSFIDCIADTITDVGFFLDKIIAEVIDRVSLSDITKRSFVPKEEHARRASTGPRSRHTPSPPHRRRLRIASGDRRPGGGLVSTGSIPGEYRHSALMRRLYANEIAAAGTPPHGDRRLNQTEIAARYGPSAMAEVDRLVLQAESTQHFEFELSDHNAVTMAEMRRLEAEAEEEHSDPEEAPSATSALHDWLPDPTPITAPLIKLLSATVGEDSRARHRARTQAYVDRRLYSNPYLRAATGRVLEIARDLVDFMEFRIYGPDPFVQPARDADPRRDIRAIYREQQRRAHRQANDSAEGARLGRFLDQAEDQSVAYAMHMHQVMTEPYYAGLYKVFFQIGSPAQYGGAGAGADLNIEAWEAMQGHLDDPYFHIGRLMAGSRQIIMSYGEVLKEVWWDPDSFSFHFPSTPQVTEVYLRSHVQAYTDDMMSAASGLLRSASVQGDAVLKEEIRHAYRIPDPGGSRGRAEGEAPSYVVIDEDEEDLELRLDPEGARPLREEGLTPIAQRYSWVVQAEIAMRTVVTRALAPSYVDAVLDEAATSSPLHAMYAERMRERVALLEELSPHQADPLQRQSMRETIDQFRGQVLEKDRRLRAAGFGAFHLAEPLAPEERELWTRDGRGQNSTRIDQSDENWGYYGNGVEFYEGQQLRFPDGARGTFLGTVRSVTERSPALRAVARSGVAGRGEVFVGRATVIGTVISTVQQIVQFIMSNWEWIASLFMTVVASPPGRVVWETWLHFGWVRIVKPLFSEGLRGIFGSLEDILLLMFDLGLVNDAIALFFITETTRIVMCYAWAVLVILVLLPFKMVLTFISGGMLTPILFAIWWVVILIAFFVPYCPPQQVMIDGHMQQTIFQYIDDIVMCFGRMDIGTINIGKGAYNGECATPLDCPGRAPCTCTNKGGQYSSVFVTFEDTTVCGTEQSPAGECICWPKLPCQFMFPRFDFQRFFDVDCAEEYGYNITEITWYQTSDYFLIAYNAYRNFWIALTYFVRILTSAPGVNPIFFTLAIGLGFLVIFYLSLYLGGLIIGIVAGVEYVLPLWKRIVIELLLPAARTVEGGGIWPLPAIATWLAGFVRFPNHEEGSPLGSPGSGEGTCFIFNSPTTIGGAALTFWFWATAIAILWYGFGPIFWLSFHHLAAPFRSAWAIAWYLLQRARRQKHIETVEAAVRQKLPQWLRRGAGRTKRGASALWRYTSPIRGALAPREPEHPLKGWIDETVPILEHRHVFGVDAPAPVAAPTTIDGRLRGWGAGTLEGEIYPTTLLGAPGEAQRRPLRPRAALRRGTVPPHLRKRMAQRRSRRTSGETPREEAWSESEKNV